MKPAGHGKAHAHSRYKLPALDFPENTHQMKRIFTQVFETLRDKFAEGVLPTNIAPVYGDDSIHTANMTAQSISPTDGVTADDIQRTLGSTAATSLMNNPLFIAQMQKVAQLSDELRNQLAVLTQSSTTQPFDITDSLFAANETNVTQVLPWAGMVDFWVQRGGVMNQTTQEMLEALRALANQPQQVVATKLADMLGVSEENPVYRYLSTRHHAVMTVADLQAIAHADGRADEPLSYLPLLGIWLDSQAKGRFALIAQEMGPEPLSALTVDELVHLMQNPPMVAVYLRQNGQKMDRSAADAVRFLEDQAFVTRPVAYAYMLTLQAGPHGQAQQEAIRRLMIMFRDQEKNNFRFKDFLGMPQIWRLQVILANGQPVLTPAPAHRNVPHTWPVLKFQWPPFGLWAQQLMGTILHKTVPGKTESQVKWPKAKEPLGTSRPVPTPKAPPAEPPMPPSPGGPPSPAILPPMGPSPSVWQRLSFVYRGLGPRGADFINGEQTGPSDPELKSSRGNGKRLYSADRFPPVLADESEVQGKIGKVIDGKEVAVKSTVFEEKAENEVSASYALGQQEAQGANAVDSNSNTSNAARMDILAVSESDISDAGAGVGSKARSRALTGTFKEVVKNRIFSRGSPSLFGAKRFVQLAQKISRNRAGIRFASRISFLAALFISFSSRISFAQIPNYELRNQMPAGWRLGGAAVLVILFAYFLYRNWKSLGLTQQARPDRAHQELRAQLGIRKYSKPKTNSQLEWPSPWQIFKLSIRFVLTGFVGIAQGVGMLFNAFAAFLQKYRRTAVVIGALVFLFIVWSLTHAHAAETRAIKTPTWIDEIVRVFNSGMMGLQDTWNWLSYYGHELQVMLQTVLEQIGAILEQVFTVFLAYTSPHAWLILGFALIIAQFMQKRHITASGSVTKPREEQWDFQGDLYVLKIGKVFLQTTLALLSPLVFFIYWNFHTQEQFMIVMSGFGTVWYWVYVPIQFLITSLLRIANRWGFEPSVKTEYHPTNATADPKKMRDAHLAHTPGLGYIMATSKAARPRVHGLRNLIILVVVALAFLMVTARASAKGADHFDDGKLYTVTITPGGSLWASYISLKQDTRTLPDWPQAYNRMLLDNPRLEKPDHVKPGWIVKVDGLFKGGLPSRFNAPALTPRALPPAAPVNHFIENGWQQARGVAQRVESVFTATQKIFRSWVMESARASNSIYSRWAAMSLLLIYPILRMGWFLMSFLYAKKSALELLGEHVQDRLKRHQASSRRRNRIRSRAKNRGVWVESRLLFSAGLQTFRTRHQGRARRLWITTQDILIKGLTGLQGISLIRRPTPPAEKPSLDALLLNGTDPTELLFYERQRIMHLRYKLAMEQLERIDIIFGNAWIPGREETVLEVPGLFRQAQANALEALNAIHGLYRMGVRGVTAQGEAGENWVEQVYRMRRDMERLLDIHPAEVDRRTPVFIVVQPKKIFLSHALKKILIGITVFMLTALSADSSLAMNMKGATYAQINFLNPDSLSEVFAIASVAVFSLGYIIQKFKIFLTPAVKWFYVVWTYAFALGLYYWPNFIQMAVDYWVATRNIPSGIYLSTIMGIVDEGYSPKVILLIALLSVLPTLVLGPLPALAGWLRRAIVEAVQHRINLRVLMVLTGLSITAPSQASLPSQTSQPNVENAITGLQVENPFMFILTEENRHAVLGKFAVRVVSEIYQGYSIARQESDGLVEILSRVVNAGFKELRALRHSIGPPS